MRKVWENENLVVRVSQIENRLLNLEGVLDVSDTTLNGVSGNLAVNTEQLPILGEITEVSHG